MFKDLYKQANDRIDTEAAKSRVMSRLEHPIVPVRKTGRARKVSQFAALAACFILTIAAATVYESFQKDSELAPIIEYVTPAPATLDTDNTTATADGTETEKTVLPRVAQDIKPKATPKPAPAKKENADVAATANEQSVTTDSALPAQQAEDSTAEVSMARAVGGGGSSGGSRMTPAPEVEVTLTEYCQYLGKDVAAAVILPEGFENNTAKSAYLPVDEDGNYTDDHWDFLFQKEEKLVNIRTTKNTEEIQAKIDSATNSDPDISKAYLVSEDIGYDVTCIGLTDAEVAILLVSLK